jgi:hypothetical protein
MKAFEIAGPRPEMGRDQMYSQAFVTKRYFIGTSSLETKEKESWVDAARPISVVAPMRAGIDCAVAATMLPIRPRAAPRVKNQRRL